MKKQLNVEDDTEGPRNLAAAMELAAGDDKDATDGRLVIHDKNRGLGLGQVVPSHQPGLTS